MAALGLFDLMLGDEGASVVVAATDEPEEGIVFGIARRMVELNEDLSSWVQVYKSELTSRSVARRSCACPPNRNAWKVSTSPWRSWMRPGAHTGTCTRVLALAQGKRETSTLIGIGTLARTRTTFLSDMRDYARANPDDTSFVWREHFAAGFIDHPIDCEHCRTFTNPALGDFLHRDAITAPMPPKMRETAFRRARLCQFVTAQEGAFLPEGIWEETGGLGTFDLPGCSGSALGEIFLARSSTNLRKLGHIPVMHRLSTSVHKGCFLDI